MFHNIATSRFTSSTSVFHKKRKGQDYDKVSFRISTIFKIKCDLRILLETGMILLIMNHKEKIKKTLQEIHDFKRLYVEQLSLFSCENSPRYERLLKEIVKTLT